MSHCIPITYTSYICHRTKYRALDIQLTVKPEKKFGRLRDRAREKQNKQYSIIVIQFAVRYRAYYNIIAYDETLKVDLLVIPMKR